MTDASATPEAGWYPDPEVPGGERWWDGAAWSSHTRAAGTATAEPVPPVPAAPDDASAATPPPYATPGPVYTPAPATVAPPVYAPAAASPYVAPYGYAPAPPSTNGLALAGLIVSCVSVLLGIFGLVAITGIILAGVGYAHATRREAQGLPNPGRGMAIAGVVVGVVSLVLNILWLVLWFGVILNPYSYY